AFGVEDARSGVQALRAAGFALVVGMDPDGEGGGQAQALLREGADLVVRSLRDLPLSGNGRPPEVDAGAVGSARGESPPARAHPNGASLTDWTLTYDTYVPEEEGLREALCTL